MGDSVIFMYMAPLMVQQTCMSCHSLQNKKTGDVMGGISINTSYRNEYLIHNNTSLNRLIIVYSLILLVGFFLLLHIGVLNKRAQLAVESKYRELHDLNAAKDKFISVIAHDLKTPAANIEALSAMLRENFDHFSKEEQRDCIDMLVDSTKTHNELLNTLLDLSRLRLGHVQYNPERLDIRKLVNEVLEQTKLQAQQKRITQSNQVEECFVRADKNMISAVMRNLVVNGIKFTHPGGKIIVGAGREDTEMIISVADTGIGIVEEKRNRIFGVNSNKSTTGTANETGTGLGLLLCKEYVERNEGHIWLESEVGKGTTFFFSIPALIQ
jgi:signal transduction histidine kinase